MNNQNQKDNSLEHLKITDQVNNAIYFVEDNGEILSAIKDNKKMWSANIIKECDKPLVGLPRIRHIEQEEDKIIVTFGKHSFAKVDINSGKIEFIGSD